jgi:hypothetical protein
MIAIVKGSEPGPYAFGPLREHRPERREELLTFTQWSGRPERRLLIAQARLYWAAAAMPLSYQSPSTASLSNAIVTCRLGLNILKVQPEISGEC